MSANQIMVVNQGTYYLYNKYFYIHGLNTVGIKDEEGGISSILAACSM